MLVDVVRAVDGYEEDGVDGRAIICKEISFMLLSSKWLE